jgi:hypothetical protein
MFNKGDKVKVRPYSRTRTIFNNADYTPGETTTYKGGWTGTVTSVFDGTPGDDIIEVHRDGYGQDDGWYEFSPGELEKLD